MNFFKQMLSFCSGSGWGGGAGALSVYVSPHFSAKIIIPLIRPDLNPGHIGKRRGGRCSDWIVWCLSDIDECSISNGGCSHSCHNSAGSFSCSCPSGLELGSGKRSCQGKVVIDIKWEFRALIGKATVSGTTSCLWCVIPSSVVYTSVVKLELPQAPSSSQFVVQDALRQIVSLDELILLCPPLYQRA